MPKDAPAAGAGLYPAHCRCRRCGGFGRSSRAGFGTQALPNRRPAVRSTGRPRWCSPGRPWLGAGTTGLAQRGMQRRGQRVEALARRQVLVHQQRHQQAQAGRVRERTGVARGAGNGVSACAFIQTWEWPSVPSAPPPVRPSRHAGPSRPRPAWSAIQLTGHALHAARAQHGRTAARPGRARGGLLAAFGVPGPGVAAVGQVGGVAQQVVEHGSGGTSPPRRSQLLRLSMPSMCGQAGRPGSAGVSRGTSGTAAPRARSTWRRRARISASGFAAW